MTAFIPTTVQDVMTEAQAKIGEVSGPGSQIYTEDGLLKTVQDAFDMILIKRGWEQYIRWDTITLDGVLGVATSTTVFEDIPTVGLEHFLAVYLGGKPTRLPPLPHNINPNVLTGTSPRHWSSLPVTSASYTGKRLQIWPKVATGTLDVKVRTRPALWTAETKLYFDRHLLIYGTAWMALEDDALNPGAAGKFQQMFDIRYRDIMKTLADHPITVSDQSGVPNSWMEQP